MYSCSPWLESPVVKTETESLKKMKYVFKKLKPKNSMPLQQLLKKLKSYIINYCTPGLCAPARTVRLPMPTEVRGNGMP